MSSSSPISSEPEWLAAQPWAVVLVLCLSFGFLNYQQYRHDEAALAAGHSEVISGISSAPWQYRVMPAVAADLVMRVTGLGVRQAYGAIDGLALLLGVLSVLALTVPRHRLIALGVLAFYLIWTLTWHRKTQTLPATAVACLFFLCLRHAQGHRALHTLTLALVLIAIEALMRADVAVALAMSAGVIGVRSRRLDLIGLALAGVALTVAAHLYLSMVAYPHASYGDTDVFQLVHNIHPYKAFAFLLFTAPFLGTAWVALRRLRAEGSDDSFPAAIVVGGVLHLAQWVLVGIADEVRIFLPFAFAATPLTAAFLAARQDAADAGR